MKEQDLLDSMSEIDDEIIERSSNNLQHNHADETGAKGQDEGIGQKVTNKSTVKSSVWKKWGIVAAVLLLAAGITILLLTINNKNNSEKEGNDDGLKLLKTYTISAAEYPEALKRPIMDDYMAPDGSMDNDAWQKYNDACRDFYMAKMERNKTQMENPVDLSPAKTSLNAFVSKGMKQFLAENGHNNRIYSPLNIYIALGMLAEVTGGNSRQQILNLLETESMDALRECSKNLWDTVYFDDGLTKNILASSMWLRDDFEYNLDTLNGLAKNYYTSSFSGQMGSPDYSTAFRNWLNEQTGGLLSDQIGNLSLSEDTVITLATTVLFNSKWLKRFSEKYTTKDTFHSSTGDIETDFMHKSGTGNYFWGDKFGATIQYFDNAVEKMLFILPDEGVSVYELLDDEQVLSFIGDTYSYEQNKALIIDFSLPRFDVASEQDINDSLSEMGIIDVFDPEKADFSPLAQESKGIYLSKVKHGVRVMADEEGVKAAAYTIESASGATKPPEERIDFVLDRPFIFAITTDGGIPLFIGVVEKP